jgi:hypothetical protein
MPRNDSLHTFEESVFEVLNAAFQRQECAAKAAARLELEVVERYLSEHANSGETHTEEDLDADVASLSSREFNADQFLTMFSNANLLRLVGEIFRLLDIPEMEAEVTSTIIQDVFGARQAGKQVGKRNSGEETFIGSDADLVLHRLRQAAAKNQRNGNH